MSPGEFGALLFVLLVALLIVCITINNVMTDDGRIRAREARDKLAAEVELAKIKALGVHTQSGPI